MKVRGVLLTCVLAGTGASSLRRRAQDSAASYDPTKCVHMEKGHCQDEDGGAWSYRKPDGTCLKTEQELRGEISAPILDAFPKAFPDVKSVVDFGGGLGAYLTSWRNHGLPQKDVVLVEPHDLGDCVFAGITHQKLDIFSGVDLVDEEGALRQFDAVTTIEVAEHIPLALHPRIVRWLVAHARTWIIFSAGRPGQGGEGHVAEKDPAVWRAEFEAHVGVHGKRVVYDADATARLKTTMPYSGVLTENLSVFRVIVSKRRRFDSLSRASRVSVRGGRAAAP